MNNKFLEKYTIFSYIFTPLFIIYIFYTLFQPLKIREFLDSNQNYELRIMFRTDENTIIKSNLFSYKSKNKNFMIGCSELIEFNYLKDKKYFYGKIKFEYGIKKKNGNVENEKYICPTYFFIKMNTDEFFEFKNEIEFSKYLKKEKIDFKLYPFKKIMKNISKVQNCDIVECYIEDWMGLKSHLYEKD